MVVAIDHGGEGAGPDPEVVVLGLEFRLDFVVANVAQEQSAHELAERPEVAVGTDKRGDSIGGEDRPIEREARMPADFERTACLLPGMDGMPRIGRIDQQDSPGDSAFRGQFQDAAGGGRADAEIIGDHGQVTLHVVAKQDY